MDERLRAAIQSGIPECAAFLEALLVIPSPSSQEREALEYVETMFSAAGCAVRRLPIAPDLPAHPLHCPALGNLDYAGRYNLEIALPHARHGLVVNTHIDVVPPAEGQRTGRVGDSLFGRGACDAKGQIAALYLAALAMCRTDIGGDLTIHLVVEEEIGGNGSLALAKRPGAFERALAMEPTGLRVATASRGAVWFDMRAFGQPGHSGAAASKNAILAMISALEELREFHAVLRGELRGALPFEAFENPMPFTIGEFHAGSWPATVPETAQSRGVFAFLPATDAETITGRIRRLFEERLASGELQLAFPFRRDGHVLSRESPWALRLKDACSAQGCPEAPTAFTACCDAFFYASQGVPTAIFGVGELTNAHSAQERVRIEDLKKAAGVICELAAGGLS